MAKPHAELAAADTAARGYSAPAAGRPVLLIDDDDDLREVARTVLAEAGYCVLTAATGAEGLQLLRERGGGLALLIVDYVMPGMNGLELIRTARVLWPRLPMLLISGYGRIDAVRELAGSPLAAFLRKPFRPSELLARVAELSREDVVPH